MARSDLTNIHQSSRGQKANLRGRTWFNDDESQWEYEYDQDEYDDVYFTVDLTTHAPDALLKQNNAAAKNGKKVRGDLNNRLRAASILDAGSSSHTRATASPVTVGGENPDATRVDTEEESGHGRDDSITSGPTESWTNVDQQNGHNIQFVGLNTASPCIAFNDDFYTSYWLSELGTHLWITSPDKAKNGVYKGDVLDVIGTSRARLMAMPAKIVPKYDAVDVDAEPLSSQQPEAESNESTLDQNSTLADLESMPRSIKHDPRLRAQATFMQKFQVLKRKKGEEDQVPLHSLKTYTLPHDAAQIRARGLDEEDQAREAKKQRGKLRTAPRLVREPGVHGARATKLGLRGAVRGSRPSAVDRLSPSTGINDDENENDNDEADANDDDGTVAEDRENTTEDLIAEEAADRINAHETVQHDPPLLRKGPKPRREKMKALGLAS